MDDAAHRVCPVEKAGHLDSGIRKWFQNPKKILRPYIQEGMFVLDFGCGPGFFSIEMAQIIGISGNVVASDLQEGMLDRLSAKIFGTDLETRIVLHKCQESRIGWTEKIDFALAFYVIHEVPNQEDLFRELASMIKPEGQILVVEPLIHVSKSAFKEMVKKARAAGFKSQTGPKVFFSQTIILENR